MVCWYIRNSLSVFSWFSLVLSTGPKDDKPKEQHPHSLEFMKGPWRLLAGSRPTSPSWDMAEVMKALTSRPFESLQQTNIKIVSLKAALLLALVTAKHVSDIHAL